LENNVVEMKSKAKEAVQKAKEKTTQKAKESYGAVAGAISSAVNNFAKNDRYETKKQSDDLQYMIDKAEDKEERESARRWDFRKTVVKDVKIIGVAGIAGVVAVKVADLYINKRD